jgi:hypothetical protein
MPMKNLIPSSGRRVPSQTRRGVNRRIAQRMQRDVEHKAAHPREIANRLRQLDEEWDIERAIEANASALAFAGVVMAATLRDRRPLILPTLVTAFLFQHAIQGWCPPVPILRALGFRTMREIDDERHALKALRGDYESVKRARSTLQQARAALRAARAA